MGIGVVIGGTRWCTQGWRREHGPEDRVPSRRDAAGCPAGGTVGRCGVGYGSCTTVVTVGTGPGWGLPWARRSGSQKSRNRPEFL